MKAIVIVILFCLLFLNTVAQVPQAFKYQAVARNSSGELLAGKNISFKISILKNSATGMAVYSELHNRTTNPHGLVDMEIGKGTFPAGSFTGINWGNDLYFIKVEMDPDGGSSWQEMGTVQLLSVPFALYAKEVQNNDDKDADPANELQKLTISGTVLTLDKSGGSVMLPAGGTSGDNWGTQTALTDATLAGNGTPSAPLKIAQQSASAGQLLKWDGSTWKPSDDMAGSFNLPFTGVTDKSGAAFSVTNSNSNDASSGISGYTSSGTGKTAGIAGTSASSSGYGVLGIAEAATGVTHGVFGKSYSEQGNGIFGWAGSQTGSTHGVWGQTESMSGIGVYGGAVGSSGNTIGVYGWAKSPAGKGVAGKAESASGTTYGVHGWSMSAEGYGVYGQAPVTGVWGKATTSTGVSYGVMGEILSDAGIAVLGYSRATGGNATGVYGKTYSTGGSGVVGMSFAPTGKSSGVQGISTSTEGSGILGKNEATTGNTYGIRGEVTSATGFSGYFSGGRFYVSGNTGIGTENPGAKLEVNGQVKISGGLPGAGKVLTSDATGLASWQSPSANPWLSNGNNIYYMAGKVGIGDDPGGDARNFQSVTGENVAIAGVNNTSDISLPAVFAQNFGSGLAFMSSGRIKIVDGTQGNGKVLTSDASGLASWASPGLVLPYSAIASSSFPVLTVNNTGSGHALYAVTNAMTGTNSGITSDNYSSSGSGVSGNAFASSGTTFGIRGKVLSATGYSGYFEGGRFYVEGNVGIGNNAPTEKLVVGGNILFPAGANRYILFPENTMSLFIGGKPGSESPYAMFLVTDNGSGAGIERITIKSDKVGIGTISPSQILDVNGNARFRSIASAGYSNNLNIQSDGTLTTATSDGRLKENIVPLKNSLEKIMQLQGVSFTWKNNPEYGTRIGFIAQEFEKIFPELVFTNPVDGYKGINYAEVTAVLTEAVRELKTENDQLKAILEQTRTAFESRLKKLETLLESTSSK